MRERLANGDERGTAMCPDVTSEGYAARVPRLSHFFGIVIAMYYDDHAPPHFHARYGEFEALIEIDSFAILEGGLPRRALALVAEWASLHARELRDDWDRARRGLPLAVIPPLE